MPGPLYVSVTSLSTPRPLWPSPFRSLLWPLFLLALLAPAAPAAEAPAGPPPSRRPDVGYVPTPQPIVDAMLKLANVQRDEIVYDLGCGDGRAVITAARDFGARGIGVDIDPERIAESRANAAAAGVADRVRFTQADLFKMKFDDADVLFLYLLPDLNVQLRPRILDELRPGSRVVSHAFAMGDWPPDRSSRAGNIPIFFWIVPAKVAGQWRVNLPDGEKGILVLEQKFQEVTGTLLSGGRSRPVEDARLSGATLSFRYSVGWRKARATATVTDGRLQGTIELGLFGQAQPWSGERR